MADNLVIVESAAKAKRITGFVGEGWCVEATRGHVRDLPQDSLGGEHLIGIAERSQDIERVFEAAEGMAIAANQREGWQHERGISLEPESAQSIGNYAAQQWEFEL